MEYQRQIKIDVPLKKAHLFMREVENLPIWTHFFKRCISAHGNEGEMETLLGNSLTSIKEDQGGNSVKLSILSQFFEHRERALVILEGDKKEVTVTFYLTTFSEMNREQQKNMVKNLEKELETLKHHLESNHA